MSDHEFHDADHENLSSPEITSLVAERLQQLRKRLLDSTRRNPLVNIPFRPNSTSVLRVVDELPDVLRLNLTNNTPMRLVPLPALEEERPDEQTDEFLDALHIARSEDEEYLHQIAQAEASGGVSEDAEIEIERALKDRIRAQLGLPERQSKESPSLTEHAKAHGICPRYILPSPHEEHEDGRHQDTDIQTLMLPEKLSRVAKGMLEKGRAYERETGVNVLHAAFGIIEWTSPGESAKYASPLLLLEIRIERRQSPRGAEFYMCGEGKLSTNTTLKQKLFAEQRLDLPEYEAGSIEDYFEKVSDAAPAGWDWKVRREVAIGIFPSSKIAMYHDLDPEKRDVAKNPLVGQLLATTGRGGASYADVYSTDDPDVAKKVPHLIMDADASQFSALVDVANGENVSIEGPPGSGKSQTIVNLIAAAMKDGKKVLFVAEKLTALDVVKNRLEASQLGEFILPLQAGKSTRDRVYQSLEDRMSLEVPNSRAVREFASRQKALEQRRQSLQDYLNALSSKFGSSGMTVYDVIGHAIATNEARELVPKDIRRIRLPDCENLGPAQIDAIVEDASGFAERLARMGRMPRLWVDTRASISNRDDAEDACERIRVLADDIEAFLKEVRASEAAALFGRDPFMTNIDAIAQVLSSIVNKTAEIDNALVDRFVDPTMRRSVLAFCDQVEEYQELNSRLKDTIAEPEDPTLLARLQGAHSFANEHDGAIDPEAYREALARLSRSLEADRRQQAAAADLPAGWATSRTLTLAQIQAQARRIFDYPQLTLEYRSADPQRKTEDLARKLKAEHSALSVELGRIRQGLPNAGDSEESSIRRTADTIEQAGVFRFMSSEFKNACNTYRRILGGNPKDDRCSMVDRLRHYANWLSRKHAFETDPAYRSCFGPLFRGFDTNIALIDGLKDLRSYCDSISNDNEELRGVLEAGDLSCVKAFVQEEDLCDLTYKELDERIAIRSDNKVAAARIFEQAQTHLEIFFAHDKIECHEIDEAITSLRRMRDLSASISTSPLSTSLGARFGGVSTLTGSLRIECQIAKMISSSDEADALRQVLCSDDPGIILNRVEGLARSRGAIEAEVDSITSLLKLSPAHSAPPAFCARLEDMRAAAGDFSSLIERARLLRSEEALRAQGFDKLVDWVLSEGDDFDPARLAPLVRAIIAKSMADRAYEIHSAWIQGYDGEDFDRIRADIIEKDRELIAMSREVVRHDLIANSNPPQGNGIGKKSTFTNMSLLRNERAKKRNRVGVRDLTRRAGQALQELKPCWMMSPLAVAQYLHSGLTFDLVVIDEASQMTPENAIGALSRAKQAVVVGDTKQLPPTTFFQKAMDDSDTDEDLREDSESILDLSNMAFRPVRQLRWHYRSRHSALIQFSNEWMYDNKLTIFPSAREDDPDFGVHLVEVDGIYRGKRNEIEARQVVQAAVRHMRENPDLSLGVCTMNGDQRDLIIEEFERERERNQHVQEYVRRWEEHEDALEHFFVKNLETIQGDERDVMFISTLYGPETHGGRPHQRFGPINSIHGHRRLNVLFTRAKRKIVTFTSLRPTDILVDDGKNVGVRMFRAWLEYCGSGYVPSRARSGGDTESPFEDYVLRQVEALGCEAVPQVGAAGYRIDIGVRHPDWPYGFILGVECDGASYHSSRSSRDRDRLRQEILEGLGWRFHRIWSTDWFNDPRTQIERLKEAIDAALAIAKEKGAPMRPQAEGVKLLHKIAEQPDERLTPAIKPLSAELRRKPKPAPQEDLFPEQDLFTEVHERERGVIGVGSKVKIEILSENGRKLAFKLVDTGNDLDNGELGIHTPIGEALLDAEEGDQVEYLVGVEVKEARILEVK